MSPAAAELEHLRDMLQEVSLTTDADERTSFFEDGEHQLLSGLIYKASTRGDHDCLHLEKLRPTPCQVLRVASHTTGSTNRQTMMTEYFCLVVVAFLFSEECTLEQTTFLHLWYFHMCVVCRNRTQNLKHRVLHHYTSKYITFDSRVETFPSNSIFQILK